MDRWVGELPLPRAIGQVPRLELMDSQREDLSLPDGKCLSNLFSLFCAISLGTDTQGTPFAWMEVVAA